MTAGTLAPTSSRRCRCGARYDAASLAALRPLQTLAAAEIAPIAVGWPAHVVVDVRACASCNAPIARLVRAERIA
ncbi:MAG: hypothetical protein JWP97_236 [Labilithrix sp.]|nr:hypothetical protein [Labilithrix sp.]